MPEIKSALRERERIPLSYYLQEDVVALSRDLLGKILCAQDKRGGERRLLITETEAYRAPEDRASHAYNYRRTRRNESMFQMGGTAYVYICYGIHHLFNIVTHREEVPHAILIRSGICLADGQLVSGPGKLTQYMKIDKRDDGTSLINGRIWLEQGEKIKDGSITASPRIGISYAREWAAVPWRFILSHPLVSKSSDFSLTYS